MTTVLKVGTRHAALVATVLVALAMATTPARPAGRDERTLRLEVLFTSDIHGHIDRGRATFMNPEFPPPLGGGASIATYLDTVRAEAARAHNKRTASYLLCKPMLPDHLEDALDQFGLSCEDYDLGRF